MYVILMQQGRTLSILVIWCCFVFCRSLFMWMSYKRLFSCGLVIDHLFICPTLCMFIHCSLHRRFCPITIYTSVIQLQSTKMCNFPKHYHVGFTCLCIHYLLSSHIVLLFWKSFVFDTRHYCSLCKCFFNSYFFHRVFQGLEIVFFS